MVYLFFFKQKTSYEMRISDWSSDVCSSDLVAEIVDRPDVAERRHRAAQAVGFLGGEIGSDHRQLHRLFLEQRNAKGVLQDVAQLIRIVRRGGRGKFRSEERRVGEGCVSTCRSRVWQ